MECFVLNTSFEKTAVMDSYESLIWTDRFCEYGDFELYIPMSTKLQEYIVDGFYLLNPESEHLMIFEKKEVKTDAEDGDHLIATGRSLESLLKRRIVWNQTIINGSLQDGIETLLNENVISPSVSERKIDNFIFQASEDPDILALTLEAQYQGEELYEIIVAVCKENKIGFKIVLNDSNQFVFSLYKGSDRSYSQTTNPYVIFSPGFENIINSDYSESTIDYKNAALVIGEGEGSDAKTASVGTASGIERREMLVDAGDLSTTTDSGTLSDTEYANQLAQRGNEELADNAKDIKFEGKAETTKMFIYGEDFFIGDLVQISDDYEHDGEAYITEIIFSQDDDGYSVYPTFEMKDEDKDEDEDEDEAENEEE